VIKIQSDIPESWYDKGIVFAGQGRFEEALAAYDKAIEI